MCALWRAAYCFTDVSVGLVISIQTPCPKLKRSSRHCCAKKASEWTKFSEGNVVQCPGNGDSLYWTSSEGKAENAGQQGRRQFLAWLESGCRDISSLAQKMTDAILAEMRMSVADYISHMQRPLAAGRQMA